MKAYVEKLPAPGSESFRCFDRRVNQLPSRYHQHPEFELTYVPRGGGTRLVGDHLCRYEDHDLVLLGGNLPHSWSSDEGLGQSVDMHEAYVTHFDPIFLGERFFELVEAVRIKELFVLAKCGIWFPPEAAAQVGERMRYITKARGMNRIIELLRCIELLCDCGGSVPLASEKGVNSVSKYSDCRMELVIDYIHEHFMESELRAIQLAEMVSMNNSAFSRRFKSVTGHTPTDYINQMRLAYARRLLLEKPHTVTDICYQSGFGSLPHFNRLLRLTCKMSPLEYRRQHLGAHDSSRCCLNAALWK